MSADASWRQALAACPLVAILRGVTPDEVVGIAAALVEAGFRIIEVPLNSPQPLESIRRLSAFVPADVLVGAGTVLSAAAVADVAAAGGKLMVSPNADPAVIAAAKSAGMVALPGVFTATDAFAALAAGADGLKLFPAEAGSPAVLKALKAVLPATAPVLAVGGITPDTMAPWRAAGAAGFGLGSALYKPGATPADVGDAAQRFIAALG